MLRSFILSLLIVVLCVRVVPAQSVFPGDEWETATPASQGMNADGLKKA